MRRERRWLWLPRSHSALRPSRHARAERRLTMREVASRYHVTAGTVAAWVAQGRFAPDDIARYDGLWIREAALAGFVAPCEQRWVRTACCRRRVPIGYSTPPQATLICQTCWPHVRVLPGGHLLRLVPPGQGGILSAEASTVDRERRAA